MRKRLAKKGWTKEEIVAAEHTIIRAENSKHHKIKATQGWMFWLTLMTGVLGACILTLAMLPILVAGTPGQGVFIALTFGFLLGLLMLYISKRMHWLGQKNHLSMALIVPLAGVASFVLVALRVNEFNSLAGIHYMHEPFLLGFMFFLGYLTPYAVYTAFHKIKRI
jgi:hypothetical protein